MKNFMVVVAVLALAGGCKKKKPEETPPAQGSSNAMGSGNAMGSAAPGSGSAPAAGSGSAMAAGSGSGSAKPAAGTPEAMQKMFETCWGYFNDAKWDAFAGCYAPDATQEVPGLPMPALSGSGPIVVAAKAYKEAFPDMKGDIGFEMINGHTLLAATLLTGTHTGTLKMPGAPEIPATNKKIGLWFAQVVEIDDAGAAKHEWDYWDAATMLGQIAPMKGAPPVRPVMDKLPGPKEVVVAKDDDKEKGNLATNQKFFDAFNKHDAKALGELADDKLVWSELADEKDENKKEWLDNTQGLWKGFTDVKFTINKSWAAGDYVAVLGQFDGTNNGDLGPIKKTGKKVSAPFLQVEKWTGGKLVEAYVAFQNLGFLGQLGVLPPPGGAPPKK